MPSRVPVTERTRRTRNPGVVLVGALASLGLHALLLTPILFGAGKHPHTTPDAPGTTTNADRPGADGAMIVELISEANGATTASARTAVIPLSPSPDSFRPPAVDLPVPELADIETDGEGSSSAPAPGDESLAAHLYGMYVGQISARIERAWLKPRTFPGADQFMCRVQVLQNASGEVLAVTLSSCNGDARWQSSLVRAIQTASPLPAAPDPRVFKRRIALQFGSDAFVAGGSAEGFEPEVRTAMLDNHVVSVVTGIANGTNKRNVIEQLRLMRNGKTGVVDLRIEGSPGAGDPSTQR
jgi:hypothetical protein